MLLDELSFTTIRPKFVSDYCVPSEKPASRRVIRLNSSALASIVILLDNMHVLAMFSWKD